MPAPDSELQQLLARLLAGSEEAAAELVRKYARPLRIVIRRHLDSRVRPVLDSVDIEQQVWASFFGRLLPGESLEDPEKLEQFLIGMARKKALAASRDHLRDKRDRRRTVPLPEARNEAALQSPQPGPVELAERQDDWSQILAVLAPSERQILQLFREGHSLSDIARQLAVSVRTINRVCLRVRELRKQFQRESAGSMTPFDLSTPSR